MSEDTESQDVKPAVNPQESKASPRKIDIGDIYPIGAGQIGKTGAQMINPYFDETSTMVAGILAVTGIGGYFANKNKGLPESDIPDLLNKNITRRQFLKGFALGLAGISLSSMIPDVKNKTAEQLHKLDMRLYSLFTNHELLNRYWLREKVGEARFTARKENGTPLTITKIKSEEHLDPAKGNVGKIHTYEYSSLDVEDQPILTEATGAYLDKIGKINKKLVVYELTRGFLSPVKHPNDEVISSRTDVIHKIYDTPMTVQFNATAPQALGTCASIEITNSDEIRGKPFIAPIIYGSSSLFIPGNLDRNSPIWDHAADRLVRKGVPPEFKWTANIHRDINMLLITEDDKQMIVSGSLDYFVKNDEYLSLIRNLESDLGVKFKLAACLDVGLAVGFTLRKDDKHLIKPVEPDFHDKDGNLDMGSVHTSSIFLIQKGV
ncbi:MAG: hypothetical protein US97_C0052G0006 [Microgenomates group bacterium GW2011_GWF1_38_5]|nr:MAG: hypothetical protein US97_C0052G0006 [Microgenomates group bacterium GW2011_GWF1_38_5]